MVHDDDGGRQWGRTLSMIKMGGGGEDDDDESDESDDDGGQGKGFIQNKQLSTTVSTNARHRRSNAADTGARASGDRVEN